MVDEIQEDVRRDARLHRDEGRDADPDDDRELWNGPECHSTILELLFSEILRVVFALVTNKF